MKNAPDRPSMEARWKLSSGEAFQFTFYVPDAERWQEKNFEIKVR